MAKFSIPDGNPAKDNIDKVLKAANRAKELVKQILAFSRQGEAERIPFQPAHVIKEALKMLLYTVEHVSRVSWMERQMTIDNAKKVLKESE